jgi:hypothetical protein
MATLGQWLTVAPRPASAPAAAPGPADSAGPAVRRRRASVVVAAAAVPLAVVGAVAVQRAGQVTWLANDFRDVGVPLVIPDVPGFRPTRAGAGDFSVQVILGQRPFPDERRGRTLSVTISREAPPLRCGGPVDRFVSRTQPDEPPDAVMLCPPERGYAVYVRAEPVFATMDGPAEFWDIGPLVPLMRLRPASAPELARLPAASHWEAD